MATAFARTDLEVFDVIGDVHCLWRIEIAIHVVWNDRLVWF